MTREEIIEYKKFMYDLGNSRNCEECPENEHVYPWPEHKLPCGQQNCWVDCHCGRR